MFILEGPNETNEMQKNKRLSLPSCAAQIRPRSVRRGLGGSACGKCRRLAFDRRGSGNQKHYTSILNVSTSFLLLLVRHWLLEAMHLLLVANIVSSIYMEIYVNPPKQVSIVKALLFRGRFI